MKLRATLALIGSVALLAACARQSPQNEAVDTAPPPAALSPEEVAARFQKLAPELRSCFEGPTAPAKRPRKARISFAYVSDAGGIVQKARVTKANFRFKEFAPCLEQKLLGLQIDASAQERIVSVMIDLRK